VCRICGRWGGRCGIWRRGAAEPGREGTQRAAVGHQVRGGGGTEGAQTIEKTKHKEDQRFLGAREADSTGSILKGTVAEGAPEIETLVRCEAREGLREATREASGPSRTERENAGNDGLARQGGPRRAGGDDGNGSATETADGSSFAPGIANEALVEILLDFEDGVDAFGGDVESGGIGKQERRVEVVVYGDVDLAAAPAIGVDDESAGSPIALGEIAIQ
jgi:hypothetical protein